jgi:hypothetical protein
VFRLKAELNTFPEVLLLLRLRSAVQKLIPFRTDYARYVLKGGTKFYAWMGALACSSWACCTCSTCRTPRA